MTTDMTNISLSVVIILKYKLNVIVIEQLTIKIHTNSIQIQLKKHSTYFFLTAHAAIRSIA